MSDEAHELTWLDQVRVLDRSDEARRIQVRMQAKSLTLDESAAGWTVAVLPFNTYRGGEAAIRAPSNVAFTLELAHHADRMAIDCGGATVCLLAERQAVVLESSPAEIRPGVRRVTINGAASYRLALLNPDLPDCRVTGDAPLAGLRGSGNVSISGAPAEGVDADNLVELIDGFEGSIRLQAVRRGLIRAPKATLQVEGDIIGSTIEAESLACGAGVIDSTITVTETLTAGSVRGGTIVQTGNSAIGLIVAGTVSGKPRVPLDAGDLLGPVAWASNFGTVEATTINATGQVLVGDALESKIHSTAVVRCESVSAAAPDPAVAVVEGQDVGIVGDVTLDAKLIISAAESLVVGGVVRGGRVAAPQVTIGGGEHCTMDVTRCGAVNGSFLNSFALEAPQLELDDSTGSELSGHDIVLGGSVTGGKISAKGTLAIGGTAESCDVQLEGTASLNDEFAGRLLWMPTSADQSLKVNGRPERLEIRPPSGDVQVTAHLGYGDATWPSIDVRGRAALVWPTTDGAEPNFNIGQLRLRPGARVTIDGLQVAIERFIADADAVIDVAVASRVSASVGADQSVRAAGAGELRLVGVQASPDGSEPDDLPRVAVSETVHLTVADGEIGQVISDTAGPSCPTLSVHPSGVVHHLEGEIRLGAVTGRVEVRPRKKGRARPPKLFGLGEGGESGVVIGVDPTEIPYPELAHMSEYHIFEADQRALIEWAKLHRAREHKRRSAAVTAQRIASQVKKTAASGSARSAAMWAAAHTHAQSVPRMSTERPLRWVHQMLGYSQRPLMPLGFYAGLVTVWVVAGVHNDWLTPPRKNLGDWGELVLKVALHPAAFLARVPESGTDKEPLFNQWAWGSIAFVTLGVALVFFVVALRNFMAPPDTD